MSALDNQDREILLELKTNLKLLQQAMPSLRRSLDKCNRIGIKSKYSNNNLDAYETLTSRLSRVADIFTQKIIRPLFILIGEDLPSFIDRANFAEKIGIVEFADDIINIRRLRNTIVHTYTPIENIIEIFQDTLNCSEKLLQSIENTNKFIKSKSEIYPKLKMLNDA